MEIPVEGLDDLHKEAINKGFAPWNIYKFFKHKEGFVFRLTGIRYDFPGEVTIYYETVGKTLFRDIQYELDKYTMVGE